MNFDPWHNHSNEDLDYFDEKMKQQYNLGWASGWFFGGGTVLFGILVIRYVLQWLGWLS